MKQHQNPQDLRNRGSRPKFSWITTSNGLKHTLCAMALILYCVVSSSATFAQGSDACGCNAVLVQGVFNLRVEKGDTEAMSDVLHIIVNSSYEEMQKSFSAGGGGSYAGYGINANMSRGEYEKKIAELKQIDHQTGTSKSSKQLLEKYGDQNVLSAWSQCKARCNGAGINSWIERQDDNYLVFGVKWIRPLENVPNPRVATSAIEGATVLDPTVPPGKVFADAAEIGGNERLVYLHRTDVSKPVVINVRLSGSNKDIAEYVPKVIPPPTPAPRPRVVCNMYGGPGEQDNNVDVTAGDLSVCRAKTEEFDRQNHKNYSFHIQCYDATGRLLSSGGQNDDSHWPPGCGR